MHSETPQRFIDDREDISIFMARVLVVCPECSRCAQLQTVDGKEFEHIKQLTCTACGFSKRWDIAFDLDAKGYNRTSYINLYKQFPLWLSTNFQGHELWFYNEQHMEYVERFIAATHRERRRDEKGGWKNSTIASRLPEWMQAAKNREKILHCIAKLKEKLPAK